MILNIGDRVHLLDTTQWAIGWNNPALGSEWYCEGVISSVDTFGYNVVWDNGGRNSYQRQDGDIELVAQEILI